MKTTKLVQLLAKEGLTPPEAADQIDRAVERILRKLRAGKPAVLPGLGKFEPGPKPTFRFQKSGNPPAGGKRGR
jgi:hypothetical protein